MFRQALRTAPVQASAALVLRRAALRPAALRPALARGFKFEGRDYPASPGFSVYSQELEDAIAQQIAAVPDPTKAFKDANGAALTPSDAQLKGAAALAALADTKRATLWDRYKLQPAQTNQLERNSAVLWEYFLNGRRILDKIPVEDPATGEITWTFIRENQKEGWEGIMYYFYVPGLLIALGFYYFLDSNTVQDWAVEELRLRAQERHGDASDVADAKARDELIVERILSGDYDKLAGLQKAPSALPSSLL